MPMESGYLIELSINSEITLRMGHGLFNDLLERSVQIN